MRAYGVVMLIQTPCCAVVSPGGRAAEEGRRSYEAAEFFWLGEEKCHGAVEVELREMYRPSFRGRGTVSNGVGQHGMPSHVKAVGPFRERDLRFLGRAGLGSEESAMHQPRILAAQPHKGERLE